MTEPQDGRAGVIEARWPRVIGVVGILVASLLFLDKIDDLFLAPLSEATWARYVGSEAAALIARMMPPMAWFVVSALAGTALAALLFIGSLRIRRRERSGIELCRKWSSFAIGWALVEIVFDIWWVQHRVELVSEVAGPAWLGGAVFGVLLALAVLLAYPVFLLVWFSKPEVRAEFSRWPE